MASRPFDERVARRVEVETPQGNKLVGVVAEPKERPPRGVVVMSPGYERCIHHYAVPSCYLTRVGYVTFRFDHTNHVGHSDGEIFDLTMSSMADDLRSALKEASLLAGDLPLHLVASSLSARAAIRVLSQASSPLVERLMLLLPVVDVRRTLAAAAGADVVALWERGEIDRYLVSEHVVSAAFARDLIEEGYGGFEATQNELRGITVPVTAVSTQADEWVALDEVLATMDADSAAAPRHLVVIEGSSHGIGHNPPALRALMEVLVSGTTDQANEEMKHLTFSEILSIVRAERAWASVGYQMLRTEQEVHS